MATIAPGSSSEDVAIRLQLVMERFAEVMAAHRKWQADWVVTMLKAQLT